MRLTDRLHLPTTSLQRVRFITLILTLASAAVTVFPLMMSAQSHSWALVPLLMLPLACAYWVHGYRRGSFPVWMDFVEAALLGLMVAYVESGWLFFPLLLVFFRSSFGSTKRATFRVLLYTLGLHTASCLDPDSIDTALLSERDIAHLISLAITRATVAFCQREHQGQQALKFFRGVRNYALFTLTREGLVSSWDEGAERVLGSCSEVAVGRSLEWLMAEGGNQAPQLLETAAAEGQARWDGTWTRHDGTQMIAEVTVSALRDDHDKLEGFFVLLHDITERERAEQERLRLHEQLTHVQRLETVGRLAGGIAHDFNNLMGVILSYTDFVKTQLREGESGEDVDEIRRAAERAVELTRQLLTFSRHQQVSPELLDLNEVVDGMRRLLDGTLPKEIELDFELSDTPAWVLADLGQLEQVLMNLTVNARDAMPDGGKITIRTEIARVDGPRAWEKQLTDGEYVILRVQDSGTGIEPAIMDTVFEPFVTTKPEHQGSGLGLSIVYGIVTQANGSIHLDSEPGKGTLASVYLPVQTEEAGDAV